MCQGLKLGASVTIEGQAKALYQQPKDSFETARSEDTKMNQLTESTSEYSFFTSMVSERELTDFTATAATDNGTSQRQRNEELARNERGQTHTSYRPAVTPRHVRDAVDANQTSVFTLHAPKDWSFCLSVRQTEKSRPILSLMGGGRRR
ncbi:hypothetical protein C8035_v009295 [Colletotrichum spinosum]|uniref:Uncharacterized protein n=1 Tax=Colletotrichum spinosum TaxID=1347390 RepID=A0A4R8QMR7_9PEZI|nr:hypothetical protein C8035_v009295 [Colletotrichum spinosum]